MGETQQRPFQLSFNRALKVDFQGSRVTSDGGLILVRELDERLGLSELMDHHLNDSRRSHRPVLRFKSFLYQAASWTMARRVVAKVEFHCGELFPCVGFIVTNLATSSRAVPRLL